MTCALAILVGVSATLTATLGVVAPMAVVVLTAMTFAHRGALGWRLAMALSILGSLVGQVLVSWAAPHMGGSYATESLAVWTIVGLVHALLAARPVPTPARWNRRRGRDLAAALAVPGVLAVYFWLADRRPGPPWIGWAMVNDAANYTLLTRWMLDDGGLFRAQANAAPLATVLHATWAAPGADGLGTAARIQHLITSNAQLCLSGWLLLGFLASVLALGSARGRTGARVFIAVVAGMLPWLWFASGIAINLGFSNAFPAMTILVLGWFCWAAHAQRPVASLTGQILAAWAAACAWGPVAIVPAAWLIATVVVERRALLLSGRRLLWPAATFAGAATYAVLVTFRDLSTTGSALAADGAAPPIERWWAFGTVAIVLLVSLLPRTGMSRTVRLGIWAGVPAAAVGAAYLVRARAGSLEWFGYYPAKFTWIVLCALAVVAVSSLQHPARLLARRGWQGNGALLVAGVVVLVMAQISSPVRPVTLASLASPLQVHNGVYNDGALYDLFGLMGRDPKSIVARFSPVPGHDSFVNFWMLQMSADDLQDPIRLDAYYMDPSNAESVCTAVGDWRGDVTVWTRDRAFAKELAAVCDPSLEYRVEVLPPAPA